MSQECPICFNLKPDYLLGTLPCAHQFCVTCLNQLVTLTCPLCRNPFREFAQQGCAGSVPISLPSRNLSRGTSRFFSTRDDLFIEEEERMQRRMQNRQRRRRRRRRPRGDGRRRRRENHHVSIFQLEEEITFIETIPQEILKITEEKKEEEKEKHKHKKKGRRRDVWQMISNQKTRWKGR